jgi:hypothetical protein
MEVSMSVPDEVRHDAEKTGELVRKKLMEIMEIRPKTSTVTSLRSSNSPIMTNTWGHFPLSMANPRSSRIGSGLNKLNPHSAFPIPHSGAAARARLMAGSE